MMAPSDRRTTPPDDAPTPIHVTHEGMLCRLQVWTEAEWMALSERARPATAERFAGLGWVGVVPVACLN